MILVLRSFVQTVIPFIGSYGQHALTPPWPTPRAPLHPRIEAGQRTTRGPLAKWALANPMLDPSAADPDGDEPLDEFLEKGLN